MESWLINWCKMTFCGDDLNCIGLQHVEFLQNFAKSFYSSVTNIFFLFIFFFFPDVVPSFSERIQASPLKQ
jgi:hypothetical protein